MPRRHVASGDGCGIEQHEIVAQPEAIRPPGVESRSVAFGVRNCWGD